MIAKKNDHKTYFFSSWPYDEALAFMDEAFTRVAEGRVNSLIGCGSHQERVVTLGKNSASNIIDLARLNGLVYRRLDRGGGITIHEPGQLVLYPVISLDYFNLTILRLVGILEETMINFLAELGITARRSPIGPGVFIDQSKVGFIGLRIKNGITSHGLAINVLNDAKAFSLIDPCGIKSLLITSARFHAPLTKTLAYYQKILVSHFLRLL